MATQITTAYRFHRLERETTVLNQPTLNPPEISINKDILTIINKDNGNFTEGYRLYVNGNYIQDIPVNFYDLNTIVFPITGDFPVNLRTYGTYFNDSDFSNPYIFIMKGYVTYKNDIAKTAELKSDYTTRTTILGTTAYLI